jgi:hypothetical protein
MTDGPVALLRDRGRTGGGGTQSGVSDIEGLRPPLVQGLVEAARCIAGRAKQAVVEMGSPPPGRPAVVKRRREHGVTGVRARTERRSLETMEPNAIGSRQTAQGQVTQRPQKARDKKYPKGLDHSGNIEGNSNGLFHHPRAHPPCPPAVLPLAPAPGVGPPAQRRRPYQVCPRARRAPGSHSPATPALSGLALWTCLVLGERLQALRCEPGERGETGSNA